MNATDPQRERGRGNSPRRDLGRALARLLCLVFALIGAVPLAGGLLLRSEPLQKWAARETSRVLRQELGIEASFSVEMTLIPLRLAITDLKVPSTDGGTPAVEAALAAVSPRFFSLLAGRLDVGDIELENTKVRLVILDGKIQNVTYRLPESRGDSKELTQAPFRSLAITNASLSLSANGALIQTEGIDLDAFAEPNLGFDVALRMGGATVVADRLVSADLSEVAHDEDRICAVDLRMFVSKEELELKRMSLLGMLDLNPQEGTFPECGSAQEGQIAVRLSQTRITFPQAGSPGVPFSARGHVMTRLPLALVDRLAPGMGGEGWAGFSGDVRVSPDTKLPEVVGKLTGADLKLKGITIAKELQASVLLTGDVVNVPNLYAKWGNGEAWMEEIKVEPFADKMPLSVLKITSKEIDFPGVLRELDVTKHSWVDWNFGNTIVSKVKGTINPFYIDGGVSAKTHDYVVWDRGFDDPARKRMIGIPRANVDGRFRGHSGALEFYDSVLAFGSSRLPIDLVSIGLVQKNLIVRLEEGGGTLDLGDVSPIADIELAGKSKIFVNMEGPREHPILKGTLSVEGLSVGGFEAGDVTESDVHFEPLFVEFTRLKGEKGKMDYHLPSARLSFDGPSKVEFTAAAVSEHFDLEEFFRVFHFDEDPRFEGISGSGHVQAQVRYLMGGPEDTCPDGRLFVSGTAHLGETQFLGEKFNEGNGQFTFEWFDFDAGTRGMRVVVPNLTLTKGTGTIFASAEVHPGGILTGDVAGTRIPISRVDALGNFAKGTDGFLSGSAELSGTVDALAMNADVAVTPLRAGDILLPGSALSVKLTPTRQKADAASVLGTSSCGRAILAPYSETEYEADLSDGEFLFNGNLLGGQIALKDLSISRKRKKVMRGRVDLEKLNVGDLGGFLTAGTMSKTLPDGKISGTLNIGEFFFDDPFASTAELSLKEATLKKDNLKIELLDQRARLFLSNRSLRSENLALVATAGVGQRGILDAEIGMDEKNQLDATVNLRPTNLSVIAAAIPGVERADGELSASIAFKGAVENPQVSGFVKVTDGKFGLTGLSSPVSDLFLTVKLDGSGLHVVQGKGNWGGGTVTLSGDAPLVGNRFGRTNLAIKARGVLVPLDENVNVGFDANLALALPAPTSVEGELPELSGNVDLLSASYEKPMRVTADISNLTSRGEKTDVEGYDPTKDNLRIDVLIRSQKSLKVQNELVVATLRIDPAGLRITGTDQRFGAVGSVEVEQGGQVFLRRSEFEIQRGLVRFNDPTRLHPEVDVTAVTEYRRYEDRGATQGAGEQTSDATGGAPVAGNWRIMMRAYGPPEDLKVDLNSDPPLAQDDIFLLLTVGLTRTELDQTQSSSVGSAVALEALGSLSGAESAVTKTVPVDEFRFGSSYSSRSGRTEPTLTIGKRLSRRIRASVTTSLGDSSEVRSRMEYRATESLSLEGSYDNAGDIASAAGGNLGGDVRWRLEFQ